MGPVMQKWVPEHKFIGVKLDHDTIPLSVAGGNVTYVSGEYASFLLLANENDESFRGLALKTVTGSMSEPNLVLILNSNKASAECSDNPCIQNIEIPAKLRGSINMLLGINYQNIFPKIPYTFPNGLTGCLLLLVP